MMFLSSDSIHGDVMKLGPLSLKAPREEALRQSQEVFLEGRGINALYICTHDELKTAEKRKLAWIAAVHDLFAKVSEGSQAADFFDQVSINILKETSPIESHSELFHNELNQRLERLRTIRRAIEESPEPAHIAAPPAAPPPAPTAPPVAQIVPKRPPSPMPQPVPQPDPSSLVDQVILSSASGTLEVAADATPTKNATSAASVRKPGGEPKNAAPTTSRSKILLILCSRNGTARQAICRFANQMNLSMEIVDYNPEQPHAIIDQIFRHRDAKFAVVYWGEPTGREMPGYAHPERYVGFGLGFALGRLGRGRVFIMGSSTTPPLPGFNRILVAQLDSTGGWQIQLARRMKAAGVDIDLNKLT